MLRIRASSSFSFAETGGSDDIHLRNTSAADWVGGKASCSNPRWFRWANTALPIKAKAPWKALLIDRNDLITT